MRKVRKIRDPLNKWDVTCRGPNFSFEPSRRESTWENEDGGKTKSLFCRNDAIRSGASWPRREGRQEDWEGEIPLAGPTPDSFSEAKSRHALNRRWPRGPLKILAAAVAASAEAVRLARRGQAAMPLSAATWALEGAGLEDGGSADSLPYAEVRFRQPRGFRQPPFWLSGPPKRNSRRFVELRGHGPLIGSPFDPITLLKEFFPNHH